jgi:hypothetical protein
MSNLLLDFAPFIGDMAGNAIPNRAVGAMVKSAGMLGGGISNNDSRQEELMQLLLEANKKTPENVKKVKPASGLSSALKTAGQGLLWFVPHPGAKAVGAGLTALAGGLEGSETAKLLGKDALKETLEGAGKGLTSGGIDFALGGGLSLGKGGLKALLNL